MKTAISILAGLVIAIALALAAPAAAAPIPAANESCPGEYEYIYAGAQCASDFGTFAPLSFQPALSSQPAAIPSIGTTVVNQTCPGEYEYIYPGAQCALTRGS